jgi:hypothetical protein
VHRADRAFSLWNHHQRACGYFFCEPHCAAVRCLSINQLHIDAEWLRPVAKMANMVAIEWETNGKKPNKTIE